MTYASHWDAIGMELHIAHRRLNLLAAREMPKGMTPRCVTSDGACSPFSIAAARLRRFATVGIDSPSTALNSNATGTCKQHGQRYEQESERTNKRSVTSEFAGQQSCNCSAVGLTRSNSVTMASVPMIMKRTCQRAN